MYICENPHIPQVGILIYYCLFFNNAVIRHLHAHILNMKRTNT